MLAQSCGDWELIIGDDASDDDSLEEACFFSDPRIKVIVQSRNRGKAIMMNRLLEEAKGRFILELDGDDWLAPDTVRLLSEALDQAPEAGMATALYAWWIRTRQMGLGLEKHSKQRLPPKPVRFPAFGPPPRSPDVPHLIVEGDRRLVGPGRPLRPDLRRYRPYRPAA